LAVALLNRLSERWSRPVDVASLHFIRVGVGCLVLVEVFRFLSSGWVDTALVEPAFHFTYAGFGWVQPLESGGMWLALGVVGVAALGLATSQRPKWCAGICALGMGYVFLIDKTHYLNHMYFLIWVCLLLAVVDSSKDRMGRMWMVDLARFQVGVVYVFGGLAKLNGDWLAGRPMLQWMDGRGDWSYVGNFLSWDPFAFALAWGGVGFDLLIVPALMFRRTRAIAFVAVVGFHTLNAVLFKIGIFSPMMVVLTTVFFSSDWCRRGAESIEAPPRFHRIWVGLMWMWMGIHIAVPLRHFWIPGDVSWSEEGHRFSWRMKLRSKVGRVVFHALDRKRGSHKVIDPLTELTAIQTRKMSTRPDMILQYAHHLRDGLAAEGSGDWAVHVDAQAALNGRPLQALIQPSADLAVIDCSTSGSVWITRRP
jgi:vitamin K-dependent gamma-carboxylase